MKTTIRFDPNVRTRGNGTRAGFEDVGGSRKLWVGKEVFLYEEESGISGAARITEISVEKRLIYLSVDWSLLHMPEDSDDEPLQIPDDEAATGSLATIYQFPLSSRLGSTGTRAPFRQPGARAPFYVDEGAAWTFGYAQDDRQVLIAQ